jgi:hypothetical protein
VVGATFVLEPQGLDQALRDARRQAITYVDDVIMPIVAGRPYVRRFSVAESQDLRSRIERRIGNVDVSRIRLWSTGGVLLFSTDDRDGSRETAPREVRRAGKGDGSVESRLDPSRAEGGSPTWLMTFIPVPASRDPSAAVAQVDQPYLPIESGVKDFWRTVRVATGAGAAFFVALFLLSLARRRRVTPVGSAGFEGRQPRRVPDPDDRALEKKLERSEEARAALEEQLGQLRTQVASAGARVVGQEQAFEAQLVRAKDREKELEGLLRDAEARAARSLRDAEFVDGNIDAVSGTAGGLEQELALTRAELEAARSRLDELEPLVASSAARVHDAESRADKGARAADARTQEVVAKADEQARQLHVASARVAELEKFVRDAEQKMAASSDMAEQSALRIRELEGKLEGARRDAEAIARRAEEAETRRSEHAGADGDAARRAEEAERRAADLESRIQEMAAHQAQLEELARAAEERAGTARFEADEALRSKQTLESKLEQSGAEREMPNGRVADLERQLVEAHQAGKRAVRAASELRAELERTQAELAIAHAGASGGQVGNGATADAPERAEPQEVAPPSEVAETDAALETNGQEAPEVPAEEGPSLRFRLARSAATKKGRVTADG